MADTPTTMNPPQADRRKADSTLELRNPDAVQQGLASGWEWIEHNPGVVIGVIALLILGGIGYATNNWYTKRTEMKAQEAYYAVEAKFTKIKEGFDRAKFKALMPAQATAAGANGNDAPASGDLAKDYGAVMGELQQIAKDHAGTAAGAQAAILASSTFLEYKQFDQAAEVAKVAAEKLGSNKLLGELARMSWGTATAAKGDCAGAVKIWQQVLDTKAATYLHADASLKSGICFESMNETEKAKEMYRRVSADSAESTSAQTAKALLRALELKAPATAAPAAPAPKS